MARLARAIIHAVALLTPRALRARWREEWLAEIDAAAERRPRSAAVIWRALGAPVDALDARAEAVWATARAWRSGAAGDFRQTWRGLLRSPRHVVTVVLCLAIGLTVSVAVFSLVNGLLYGEIPGIQDRHGMVRVFVSYENAYGSERIEGGTQVAASPLSMSDFETIATMPDPTFTGWAAEGDMRFAVSFNGTPTGTSGVFVSPDYFQVLGTQPAMGRLLAAPDAAPSAPPAVVIGFNLWRDRLGAPADIIGRSLLVGTGTYTIVGVAPARFTGLQPPDVGMSPLDGTQLWVPMRDARGWRGAPSLARPWLSVRARLAPGKTMDDAKVSMQAAAGRLVAAYPRDRRQASFVVSTYGFGPGDSPIDVLIVVALFLAVPLSVLAIGCANVANLQLARATERARELAVRLAMGASRGQIIRLLSFEAAVLSLVATSVGCLGARAVLDVAQEFLPMTVSIDRHVLLFASCLGVGITMLSGLAPAWLVTRRSMARGLQQSERSGGLAHARLRHALVVTQIAVSLVLLTLSGVFVQSVRAMRAAAPVALRTQIVAPLDLDLVGYTPAERRPFLETFVARLASDPRVRAVSVERLQGFRYRVIGAPADARPVYSAGGYVTPSWVDVSDAHVVAGRGLRPDDGQSAALVSVRFAERLAEQIKGDALGQSLEVSTSQDAAPRVVTIVGVVENLRGQPDQVNPVAALYLPMPVDVPAGITVRARTDDPEGTIVRTRAALRAIDARLPWDRVEVGEAGYLRGLREMRYLAMSVGGFGVLAMVLAAAGLFAITAYVVSLRTREIGIRVAIGAARGDVMGLVVRHAMRLAVLGALVGVGLAVPIAFALRSVAVGVSPLDPLAMIAPVALMFVVSLVASVLPARRAASIDPVRALRAE